MDYEWAYTKITRIVSDYNDGDSSMSAVESMRLIEMIVETTNKEHVIVCSNDGTCPICTLFEEATGGQ